LLLFLLFILAAAPSSFAGLESFVSLRRLFCPVLGGSACPALLPRLMLAAALIERRTEPADADPCLGGLPTFRPRLVVDALDRPLMPLLTGLVCISSMSDVAVMSVALLRLVIRLSFAAKEGLFTTKSAAARSHASI
jgi:hypothetical protein